MLCAAAPERFVDLDSSEFSRCRGRREPRFPGNYIDAMLFYPPSDGTLLVSTHQEVRTLLSAYDVAFGLVYPERRLRDEYLERFRRRGSPQEFVDLMAAQWDAFLDDLEREDRYSWRCVLGKNQYLVDATFWVD